MLTAMLRSGPVRRAPRISGTSTPTMSITRTRGRAPHGTARAASDTSKCGIAQFLISQRVLNRPKLSSRPFATFRPVDGHDQIFEADLQARQGHTPLGHMRAKLAQAIAASVRC